MDDIERRLLIEQTKKEVLDEIKKYKVAWVHNGEMIVTQSSESWQGYIFVIPDEKYEELFKGG